MELERDDGAPRGLIILPDMLTAEEEAALLKHVYDGTWESAGAAVRRVQQFGARFDYARVNKKNGAPLPPSAVVDGICCCQNGTRRVCPRPDDHQRIPTRPGHCEAHGRGVFRGRHRVRGARFGLRLPLRGDRDTATVQVVHAATVRRRAHGACAV